jgi:predicted Ser/Thr protein kinase
MVNSKQREIAAEELEQSHDELPPGTKLSNGTYTIVEHLKSGGFGITYLATDTLGRRVVIKECFPSGICTRASQAVKARSRIYVANVANLVEKFVAEAHSLAKLTHPNIVKVHQVFKENDTAYMALDYVEGHDLLEVMTNSSLALTPAGVRSTLLKLLDAVGAVHEKGLLHRDISPDNILIDGKRQPILIDFGAAREQERTESAASTLHVVKDGYSPQELYLSGGGDQGPWSDLYSLAASFYHLIACEAPVNSQARLAALASNSEDPCIPLAGRFDAYDPAFLAAIDKAMSVLPKQRMQSARQWLSAITEGDAGKVVQMPVEPTRMVTPMTRVTRFEAEAARKKIGPIALIGGVAVLALIATGVFLAMPRGEAGSTKAAAPVVGKATAARTASSTNDPSETKATETAQATTAAAKPAAETPAPAAETVAAAPAVEPAQAAPAAPADVTALTSNWTIDLPFAAAGDDPTMVATTRGPVPDWLIPGVKITAVNGTPVNSLAEISAILRETQQPADAAAITATLTAVNAAGQSDQTIDLPVVHRVVLVSGAEFQVRWVEGAWRTEVTVLPDGYAGEMRVGDLIVGHVKSGARMTGPNDLKTALEGEIIAGSHSTTLAVQQGGQMWVVTFPLPG